MKKIKFSFSWSERNRKVGKIIVFLLLLNLTLTSCHFKSEWLPFLKEIEDSGEESIEKKKTGGEGSEPVAYKFIKELTMNGGFSWPALLPPKNIFDDCAYLGEQNYEDHWKPVEFVLIINLETGNINGYFSNSRGFMTGKEPLQSFQSQDYTVEINSDYEVKERIDNQLLVLTGTVTITITSSGWRNCGYWICPKESCATGEFEFKTYTIENDDSIEVFAPCEIRIYRQDEVTSTLEFTINTAAWAENSDFSVVSDKIILSDEEADFFWGHSHN